MDSKLQKELQAKCLDIKRDVISIIYTAGSGHPGGSLSAVEILTVLYFQEMKIRTEEPAWPDRDKFILSKGHAAPLVYAVLAERGFFPKTELATFNAPGTNLQKHLDMHLVPGVELSTGSLGQGLSAGIGMALAARLDKRDSHVYVLVGDGELQEGQIWEAAMSAAQFKVDNLIVFLDKNNCQVDGFTRDICNIDPVDEKWQSFGWHVQTIDGHDLGQIEDAIVKAKSVPGKPHIIIANTIKGKGISYMENKPEWHARAFNEEEYKQAMEELYQQERALQK
jgi:transketolase